MREGLRRRIEQRYGRPFADIDRLADLGRLRLPALLVHDAGDRHVPFAHGERIAAALPDARLVRTHGFGHFRILRQPAVHTLVAAFVAGEDQALPADLPRLPPPAPLY